jgi:predicted kinase
MDDCRGYMRLAGRYLSPAKPILIITYGLPGCGKTTVSQVVLEQLQAIRLRSDVERKRLFGLAADADSGGTIYDAAATQRTYAHLLQLAGQLLNDGFSVVVDAAFLKHGERQAFRELAANKQLPFIILSVQTDFALLKQRIESRQQQGKDASEADLNIVEKLQAANEPLRADESACVVEWQNNQALDDSARQALIAKIIHLAQNA